MQGIHAPVNHGATFRERSVNTIAGLANQHRSSMAAPGADRSLWLMALVLLAVAVSAGLMLSYVRLLNEQMVRGEQFREAQRTLAPQIAAKPSTAAETNRLSVQRTQRSARQAQAASP